MIEELLNIEKSKKISKTMLRCLNKLSYKKWKSSYEVQESLSTLSALQKRGLVERKVELGYLFTPHTAIKWRII